MKKIPVAWLKNTSDGVKREELESIIRASSTALLRLYDLIEEKELSTNNQEVSESSFDNPNWAAKQAFLLGKKSALADIKALLEFIKG